MLCSRRQFQKILCSFKVLPYVCCLFELITHSFDTMLIPVAVREKGTLNEESEGYNAERKLTGKQCLSGKCLLLNCPSR